MITLASDFGSPYPAAMRGVLSRRTDARLLDVAHDLPRQDCRAAAFWLRETLPWFPPATHLAVVDPGVGTGRAAVVVEAGDHLLVGPDNGTLLPPARRLAGGGPPDPTLYRRVDGRGAHDARTTEPDTQAADDVTVYRIDDDDARSSTFHGRDVFAPAAALVHERGIAPLRRMGILDPLDSYATVEFPEPTVDADGAKGEVLVVDDFGNLITNVPGRALDGVDRVVVRGEGAAGSFEVPGVDTFDAVAVGDRLATVGSHGNVELDVNRGRGDDAFGLSAGDHLELLFDP